MKSIDITLGFAAAMMLLATGAFAQTPAPAGGGMSGGMGGGGRLAACRDDSQKYCADKRGPDRRACLNENKDKLSSECKAALAPTGN